MRRNMLFFVLILAVSGCSFLTKKKPDFFNDSDRLMANEKGVGVCQNVPFDCVIMSKGQFRNLTGQDVVSGKQFIVTYIEETPPVP